MRSFGSKNIPDDYFEGKCYNFVVVKGHFFSIRRPGSGPLSEPEPESEEANVQLLQLLRRHLTVSSRPQSGQSTSSDFLQVFSKHLAAIGFPHSLHNVS